MLVETALLKAIKYCGSKQRNLAKLIGEDPDKISYWLNRAKHIPFHQAIAIELATNGLVSRFDLAPYARLKNKRPIEVKEEESATGQSISERVAVAIEIEKTLGHRQGKRSDLADQSGKGDPQLGRRCIQVKGKTAALAAKKAGFTSCDTYLRAKKVVLQGIFKLVQAMDKKHLAVAQAAAIANFSPEEQEALLTKNKKELVAYLQRPSDKRKNKSNSNHAFFMKALWAENELIEAEHHYQLPLRLLWLGLLAYGDEFQHFPWEPDQLKREIAPFIACDFNLALTAFSTMGFIRKSMVNGKVYGQLLKTIPFPTQSLDH